MLNFFKSRLHPFAHPSFRFFFFAQSISAMGTWSHELARSWLVLEIAGTATALGTLLISTALPGLFLTLHGGALADRTDARKLLIATKGILALSAFSFFILAEFYHIELWMIYMFGIIEGLVGSFDGPAFSSIFARTLPKADFAQGLAIHSTSFHVSRMLGPAIAGILMAYKGPSLVFLFDGVSYLFVIYMIMNVKLRDRVVSTAVIIERDTRKIVSSMKFFFNDPTKRYKQYQLYVSIMIIIPLLNLVFRTFLKQKFSLNAAQFGYVFSFPAMGAMLGALYITFSALKRPMRNLIVGVPMLVIGLLLVRHVTTPFYAGCLLGVCGFFSYLNVASITQSMHIETPDEYRGRLGSLLTLGFFSIGPLMSFPIGIYTDHVGYDQAIRDFTLLFATISIALAYSNFRKSPKDVM